MISQTLTLFGFSTDSLTYNVTSSANGCTGSQNHAIARVMPTTPTTFTICNDPVTTTNAAPITLRGGIPLGGVYSGAGVSGGVFDPSVAGAGNHVITYTYTNSQTCSMSATQTLSVLASTPFTCGTTFTDVRDAKVYSTVLVGGQCWMADNLNYGNAINSTIPQRDNCIIEKYCYAESTINCNTQGGFYQWDEVMHYADIANGQGICPPGWHIPDETEWIALFNQFGPRVNAIAGRELTVGGTSTFDAFFYGFSNMNRGFNHHNFATMFWTSTSHGPYKAWAHGMNDPDDGVSSYPGFRNNAFHVRCVR
jgi:uncharacterized protein (TIGR02145 family)